MARIDPTEAGGANVVAFLDMIAVSEMGRALLARSDDGYNVIVGSTPTKPILFDSYGDHPHKMSQITLRSGAVITSSAAGRYQLLWRYWNAYRRQMRLADFSPENQDRIAIQQLKETRAYGFITDGKFYAAIERAKRIWASLPGAGYGQHENSLDYVKQAYLQAGGVLA